MNERIDELAEQAGAVRYDFDTLDGTNLEELKKFAELIVRECIDIAINAASDTNFITGISKEDKRSLSIAVEIRNHFGVNE